MLGTNAINVGGAIGMSSVELIAPSGASSPSWSVTSNSAWLHLNTGTGSPVASLPETGSQQQ